MKSIAHFIDGINSSRQLRSWGDFCVARIQFPVDDEQRNAKRF